MLRPVLLRRRHLPNKPLRWRAIRSPAPCYWGWSKIADAVMPAWAHQQALRRLLLPDGAMAEHPQLQGWEEAMARGHLNAVLHNAESLGAAALLEMDTWLADVLCQSWPRSAPPGGTCRASVRMGRRTADNRAIAPPLRC
jgi:hypothetical protein